MLERILERRNLNEAYRRVKRNHGAGGVDGMSVEELGEYLAVHKEEILRAILGGKYRPNPVLRVEIPKEDGKKRPLGIPTAVDRVIQQAIAQVLTPIYEPKFAETSYGFRPGRSAHDALRKCLEYIDEGYKYVVDMDLEKFFDTVNQSKMIQLLSRDVEDGRVISLIHKYLRAGVIVCKKFEETEAGVPQGGPLSPLLANVLLNELDHELESRGHNYVRYADDMLIFCKSKRAAERTLENITPYIENKLFLKVNRDKTSVSYVRGVKFLGYSFRIAKRGIAALYVHPKSIVKMKSKIRELTSRSNGWGNDYRKLKLKQFITGWVQYFKLAGMKTKLQDIDEWMRHRIRVVIFKQWKKPKTKYKNLRKLGISHSGAYKVANTSKGYWRAVEGVVVKTALTNDRLRQAGYVFFSDYYQKVSA
ncbi:MAG: group II intron reverse transcriptase/maturase [Oscillospiraceae bacterium]|nr:group II intron reverse transcriptase/maturase [Oscillospiraceae bacterium]